LPFGSNEGPHALILTRSKQHTWQVYDSIKDMLRFVNKEEDAQTKLRVVELDGSSSTKALEKLED